MAVREADLRLVIADTNSGWHDLEMDIAYVLHHVRSDDEYGDDAKLIGVYRCREAASAATKQLSDRPGFREHPTGFVIDAYPLDKDHWSEGFGLGE